MAEKRKISLVLADVDGTLVTEEKVLTERAQAAVQRLRDGGHPLRHHQRPAAQGHGHAVRCRSSSIRRSRASTAGSSSSRTSSIIEQKTLPADVAAKSIELIRGHGLDAWVYRGNDWLITKADAPHVAREAWTVKFEPKVVADVAEKLDQVAKIVGVSDDLDKVQRCEADAQAAFGDRATANRSQPYYLDITHKDANKGAVAEYLSSHPGRAGGGDRHHRRPAQRRAHVQAVGLQHRDGQCAPIRSRRRPASPPIPTMTKASPRRWNASFWARWREAMA